MASEKYEACEPEQQEMQRRRRYEMGDRIHTVVGTDGYLCVSVILSVEIYRREIPTRRNKRTFFPG